MKKAERYYDKHIAPELLRLSKLCQDNGLSFLALVEWSPGDYGRTLSLQANSGLGIRLADTAAKANGNVDSLFIAISRYARDHGHSSIYLSQLGIPTTPAEKAES